MANLTIKEQPSEYCLGKSPILYAVLSIDYAFDDFEYIADVYIWQGDITSIPVDYSYRLRKPRNVSTGATTFDVSSLSGDFFKNIPSSFSTPDDTDELETYVLVKFGYAYTDGTGTGQEEIAVTTSNTATILNGYSYYADGINYYPNSYLGRQSGDYMMTDRPLTYYVPNDTKLYLNLVYDAGQETEKIKIGISSRTASEVVYTDLTTYDEGLLVIGVGVEQLPTHTTPNADIISYTITGVDSGNVAVTETYTFVIDNGCKYGYKNIQYLNRFGVWDNMIFRGARQDSFNVDKGETMLTPLSLDGSSEFDFNQSKGQMQNFINNGMESFTLNTGWIDEEWNEMIKQLMMSPYVFDSDTLEPYTVDSSSLQLQSAINDKVINYSLTFKKAFTFINTVN